MDVLDNCDKYCVNIGNKNGFRDWFADDNHFNYSQ